MKYIRSLTPAEWVIVQAIYRFWKIDYVEGDGFNMIIDRAATSCGVSYERAEWLAQRALGINDWLFPPGGWGVFDAKQNLVKS